MGAIPSPSPEPAVRCPRGHQNPPGRQFCQQCGSKLVSPRPVITPGDSGSSADATEQLQSVLVALQNENQALKNEIQSLQNQITTHKTDAHPAVAPEVTSEIHARLASAETKAATLEPQISEWQMKWKSAEEKAKALELALSSKVQELDTVLKSKPVQELANSSNKFIKWIAGALAVVASFGGYGVGRMGQTQPSAQQTEQINRLSNQLTTSLDQTKNLRSQLDAANDKLSQVSASQPAEADPSAQSVKDLTGKVASLESQVTNLGDESRSKDMQIAALKQRLAAPQPASQPLSGALVWSGNVVGKLKVEINDGLPNVGKIIGSLPGLPCTVSISDPAHVKLKTVPNKNNRWRRLTFEVSAPGNQEVRINWQIVKSNS